MQGENQNNSGSKKVWALVALACLSIGFNLSGMGHWFFDALSAQASEPNTQQQVTDSMHAALNTPSQSAAAIRDADEFSSTREPGFSPVELDVVRTQDGKLQIRSVDVHSRYASKVKQNQVFNSWSEIWAAIDNE